MIANCHVCNYVGKVFSALSGSPYIAPPSGGVEKWGWMSTERKAKSAMDVWFHKLICHGVLMVGEYEIMFLYHPGCLHQEIANHHGLDVMHFEYSWIGILPTAQYNAFPVSGVCPQKSSKRSWLPKSSCMGTMFSDRQSEWMLILGWRVSEVFITSFVNSTCQIFLRWWGGGRHPPLYDL